MFAMLVAGAVGIYLIGYVFMSGVSFVETYSRDILQSLGYLFLGGLLILALFALGASL
jgi:hypothetical protein